MNNVFKIIHRTATARGKAEQADIAAIHAREDSQLAVGVSKDFGGKPVSDAASAMAAMGGSNLGLKSDLVSASVQLGNSKVLGNAVGGGSSVNANPVSVSGNNLLNVKNNHISSAATPASSKPKKTL